MGPARVAARHALGLARGHAPDVAQHVVALVAEVAVIHVLTLTVNRKRASCITHGCKQLARTLAKIV